MIKLNKFGIRFFVVLLIHAIFKSFDLSFPNGIFEISWRSFGFSVYFVSYGMVLWYLSEQFEKLLRKKITDPEGNRGKTILLIFCHAIFAYALMCTVNYFYRIGDFKFFDNAHIWHDVPPFNPQLTVALTCMYLSIYGFDSYWKMHSKLQENLLKEEQLKRENITAQYKALKAQIEPHFLFNSLSVLSSLVHKDADLSADFVVNLSKTLRYVIEKNACNLVKLSEELEFLYAYFFLIKTRLDNGVFLENKIEFSTISSTYIPPVTLQLLIENAVNHNSYNPDNPLKIIIDNNKKSLIVRNVLNPRAVLKKSTKQGLKNVAKRYKLISDKEVEIIKTETEFIVKLPLLNQSDYEMSLVKFNI